MGRRTRVWDEVVALAVVMFAAAVVFWLRSRECRRHQTS
jgi:hypothetical protein